MAIDPDVQPFLDVLASRVERIETGVVREDAPTGLIGIAADVLRSLREELRQISPMPPPV